MAAFEYNLPTVSKFPRPGRGQHQVVCSITSTSETTAAWYANSDANTTAFTVINPVRWDSEPEDELELFKKALSDRLALIRLWSNIAMTERTQLERRCPNPGIGHHLPRARRYEKPQRRLLFKKRVCAGASRYRVIIH